MKPLTRTLSVAIAALCMAPMAAARQSDDVTLRLRGEGEPLVGVLQGVDARGVLFRPRGVGIDTPSSLIPWSAVRAATGKPASEIAPWLPLAERCWRALARLERGDLELARPELEALYEELCTPDAHAGPTGLLIAKALAACRSAQGARVGAVEPALYAVRLSVLAPPSGAPARWDLPASAEAQSGPVALGLPLGAAPIWIASPALRSAVRDDAWRTAAAGESVTEAMARWYRAAALFELGAEAEPLPPIPDHAGVNLVSQIVLSRIGDKTQRASARDRVRQLLASSGGATWRDVWREVAIGRSLLREEEAEIRMEGVLTLVRVRASWSSADPRLAGLALAEAIVTLDELGASDDAERLARDFRTTYPDHDARQWAPLAEILRRATSAG